MWTLPECIFHVFGSEWSKNDPKVGRVPDVPVQMEENGDHHRISHGLKPLIQ